MPEPSLNVLSPGIEVDFQRRRGNSSPIGILLPKRSKVPELAANPNLSEDWTPSRVDRRVQEFRSRVLETAETLFAERGVEATKIADICEAADVAKRTLCNHFPTKAHIVQSLSREAVSRFVALVDDARENGRSNRERLRLLFDQLVDRTHEFKPVHRESVGAFFQVAH
jgi:hypothetical protein